MSTRRGWLIVLEGVDKSGKSTQARLLKERLTREGRPAEIVAFPDRKEPFGEVIDRYLRREVEINSKEALHLAFSLNRWQKAEELRQKIASGTSVICDRYCFSGVAYSIASGVNEAWARQADIGLPQPDVVLYFKVDKEVAVGRGGFGDERLEGREFQARVALEMDKLQRDYWKIIDANQPVDTVSEYIYERLKSLVPSPELRTLTTI